MAMPHFAEPENLEVERDEQLILPVGTTAKEALRMVYRGEIVLSPQQMRAAIESLPYGFFSSLAGNSSTGPFNIGGDLLLSIARSSASANVFPSIVAIAVALSFGVSVCQIELSTVLADARKPPPLLRALTAITFG
jgi:hypothetical protein